MERDSGPALDAWLAHPRRKPLVLRGARQVGKTWLVRDLCRRAGRGLVEINLERDPGYARHFQRNDPVRILAELSLTLGRDVAPEKDLLFIDEIQAAPELLAKLRWFADELPALPVVAAGSLLEFTLAEHSFSMPVGRIGFRHVEPMSFPEYLRAHQQGSLLATLQAWNPGQTLSVAAHASATTWLHRYSMVGGMPTVVEEDVERGNPRSCRALQRDLIATYRADFARYRGRLDDKVLDAVLQSVALSVGRKFVYARVDPGLKQHQAKRAFEMLGSARLCHLVRYSAANGLPLAGETKDTFRKAILVDVGLWHALIGTPAEAAFPSWEQLTAQTRGALIDQLVGQQLRASDDPAGDGPQLFYWQRDGGRPGEIDFLIAAAGRVVPIELKAGAGGAMKSLHQFMHDKRLGLAVRIDANPPSEQQLSVRTTQGDAVSYRLISVPVYLAWRLREGLASWM